MEEAKVKVTLNGEDAQRELDAVNDRIKKLIELKKKAEAEGDVKGFKKISTEIGKAEREAKKLERQFYDIEKTLKNLNGASIEDLQKAERALVEQTKKLNRETDLYAQKREQLKLVKQEMAKINGTYREQTSFLSRAADGFNKYLGVITAGAATLTGFILAGKKAVETFNEFQSKISELSALTGLAGDDLNWLADQAKELSISTQEGGIKITKSATEILDAYKLMGSAKPELLKDKEALNEVTTQAIILAEAAKMETGPAVEALASIMNQFGAPASEAGKYINILAAGSKEGAAEVGDLSDAIIRSGAAATQANVSIEQEVALVETLAEKGIKAERAGTGLRGFILKLQKGADEFNPKVVGMSQALENLAAKNLSAKDMMELFGEESYTVASLLINNRTRFDELTTAVTGTNTAFVQAATNTDNNAAKLAQAQNKAQLMRIELGEKLAPAMTMAVSSGTFFMKVLNAMVDLFSKHGTEIILVTGAIAGYTLAVQAQTAATKANALWTNLVTAGQKTWSVATGIATGKITIATIAQQAWNLAMKMNPIGAIIAGVMALAAGAVWLAKKMNEQTAAQIAVNDVTKEAQKAIVEQKLKVQDLLKVAKDEKRSLEERKAALKALNEISPEYFGNLSIEKSTTEQLTKASDDYILSLQKQALVKAAQDKIDKLRADYANAEIEGENNKVKWYQKTGNFIASSLGIQSYAVLNAATSTRNAADAQAELNSQLEAMNDIIKKNSPASNNDTIQSMAPIDNIENGSNSEKNAKAQKEAYEKALKILDEKNNERLNLLVSQYEKEAWTDERYKSEQLSAELAYLTLKKAMAEKFGQDVSDIDASINQKRSEMQKSINDVLASGEKELFDQIAEDAKTVGISIDESIKVGDAAIDEIEKQKDREADILKKRQDAYMQFAMSIGEGFGQLMSDSEATFGDYLSKTLEMALEAFHQFFLIEKYKAIMQGISGGLPGVLIAAGKVAAMEIAYQGAKAIITKAFSSKSKAQQYASGKYPVMGADDGRMYDANYTGRPKTGIYSGPQIGLFNEDPARPELVVDGRTTRQLMINYPAVYRGIRQLAAGGSPQFADGKYPASAPSPELVEGRTTLDPDTATRLIDALDKFSKKELILHLREVKNGLDNVANIDKNSGL